MFLSSASYSSRTLRREEGGDWLLESGVFSLGRSGHFIEESTMVLTRRQFLIRTGAAGGASFVYEAMAGLGLLAAPTQTPFDLSGRVSGVRVVVLGAGLTGLTVAYELGKVGY